MALFRHLSFVLISCYVSISLATATTTTTSDYAKKSFTKTFDPNIECDVAELALDYAMKLQPFRDSFASVYDALELKKCNTTVSNLLQPK